ncbi:MAG: UDP-N-acetylmuramate:L-alanyl-gamma-D-glutamyl-meso-diaminopimelate ligase [Pseudomonadota bacterium]
MRLHILGICGTFMAGIALLAKEKGFTVTGSDANAYPPMSIHLQEQDISVFEGYDNLDQFSPRPDLIIMGNTMKRGNPCVEYVLNEEIPYTSGPQWLAENVLNDRHVLAIAGTHGKTTVTSLLSWILEYAGLNPGFLIGGVAKNFTTSARLGNKYFILEADEYDTAFFDKRPKFIHYHPRTLILNNLEFDHVDIFPDLNAIKLQFAYLLRTVPSEGLIICPKEDKNLQAVLSQGCWTPVEYTGTGSHWQTKLIKLDASQFTVSFKDRIEGEVSWELLGQHNASNALAAIVAANHIGIEPNKAITALNKFQGIKRRLEIYKKINDIMIYDDFAHHPTAIASTLAGLRQRVDKERILVVLQCSTHTMRSGIHSKTLGPSLKDADKVWLLRPKQDWNIEECNKPDSVSIKICDSISTLIKDLAKEAKMNDHIVIMSNSGFESLHEKLVYALST